MGMLVMMRRKEEYNIFDKVSQIFEIDQTDGSD